MRQPTKRLFGLSLAVFLVVGAIIIYFELTRPAYEEIRLLKGKQISLENLRDSQRTAINKVKEFLESYDNNGSFRDAVSAALPSDPEVSNVLSQIDGLLRANGLVPQSFSVTLQNLQNLKKEETVIVKPVGVLDVRAKFSGSYENLKSFLDNLEDNVRIFDVQSLSIGHFGKPTENVFVYDAVIKTYYQAK